MIALKLFWDKVMLGSWQCILSVGASCRISGDVNFDHLIKGVSARFLHCEVIIFSFVINKYVGKYLETT